MLLAALATLAIVTQDQTALRSAPRATALQQSVLWQGDVVEVRGERLNYLQVYDHRHELAGYIRATQVQPLNLQPEAAPALLSVVRFLRNTQGSEALGISYVAAYLKAAPASAINAEPFDALGSMADRLGRQASARVGRPGDAALAAHLEVAASFGVTYAGIEHDDYIQLCYDGDAFKHVLALAASPAERARAVLALTRDDCVDPKLTPQVLYDRDNQRAALLDQVALTDLSGTLKNSVRLRRAGVWATLAFERRQRAQDARSAAERALQELAGVEKGELSEDDIDAYSEAAIRVGASRWAASDLPASVAKLSVVTAAGAPGETCIALVDVKHDAGHPLFKRCTYGVVWGDSASANAQGTALALAVQPLAGWRELWVFQRRGGEWGVDILPPATVGPDLGYIEFAGWVPGAAKLLAAREMRVNGRYRTTFEVIGLDSLEVEHQSNSPTFLSLFYRWQEPRWKHQTVSVR